jgi:hypothetical protein
MWYETLVRPVNGNDLVLPCHPQSNGLLALVLVLLMLLRLSSFHVLLCVYGWETHGMSHKWYYTNSTVQNFARIIKSIAIRSIDGTATKQPLLSFFSLLFKFGKLFSGSLSFFRSTSS